ncbi:Vps54p NDAI_0A05810 [Naumovozyma dairenensis CBS 421]|uniref:Vacuolar protein sorting-associated protein 54 C-terminal domain-containing protein n=1 Tax=Naumovozyma dairenensis (strain ATCC 10597 / BCRC 20456 / CBS 421 / NBRC 0211 / NRRL Y-12639) TaxID=1071378 RepID=G0W4J8_NAUDC|nr:hypothetical protein NDAI_0A05810 [Naumovozyma dairenensis CBS 421]CCD22736.1 hypothetical protein NDAI_0A05810 [Naumovozyma dairenensis CBS 421]
MSHNGQERLNQLRNPHKAPPQIILPHTPSSHDIDYSEHSSRPITPTDDDTGSLNDDLLSVHGSTTQMTRPSIDSASIRRSFESSHISRSNNLNNYLLFDTGSHSGSMDYSPLGNNSIFEIVMNTRRKNWLNYPTVIDIPPVTLSRNELDSNWKNLIKSYVGEIKDEYEAFENSNSLRNMNRLEQLKQLKDQENNEKSNEDLTSETFDSATTNGDAASYKQNDNGLRDLAQVPDFFFERDFHLDNQRTFHHVLGDIDLSLNRLTMDDQKVRDDAYIELREQLSNYLDTVENLLVNEISKSSNKFFRALSEVDDIERKANDTIVELDELMKTLNIIDKEKLQTKIENLQLLFKRKNVEKLEQSILQIKLVLNKTEECKELYRQDEYDSCLNMIKSIDNLIKGDDAEDSTVQAWTNNWPYKLIHLKTVPALSETREYLTNMKIEIGGKFSVHLTDLLLKDLRSYSEAISVEEALDALQNGSTQKKHLEFDEKFQTLLTNIIHELNRCEELASSFQLYQDKFIVELKAIIKSYLPNESSATPVLSRSTQDLLQAQPPLQQTNTSGGSKLSRLIKEQTPVEFQEMLVATFTHANQALKRLYGHQKILLDLSLKEINSIDRSSENQHNMITQLDIRSGINEGIRIIQLRMGKIIAVRREMTSALRYDHFLHLYSIVVLFIQECETLSGEFLTKYLSDVLAVQLKNYIAGRESKNSKRLQKKIDVEKWVPYIVDSSVQKNVNDIVSSIDMDPIDWISILDLTQERKKASEEEEGSKQDKDDRKVTGHRKSVVVGDKTFVASASLLTAIDIIKELLILSTNIPSTYLPNCEKLCFNILKVFNTATMSSITEQGKPLSKTGKNLSIIGESLDCLAEFVNMVQLFYQRYSDTYKDFIPYDPSHYAELIAMYRTSSERLYMAHAPPPV